MEIHHAGVFANTALYAHEAKNTARSYKTGETDAGSDSRQFFSVSSGKQPGNGQLDDPAIKSQLNALRARDQEVRAHELAHASAAGGLSKGGPSFDYQRGPDGQLYAVGGEVQIDTSGVPGDPEATLEKAIQIQQAALAPAQPSAQDRSVAIAAAAMAAQARAELNNQNTDTPESATHNFNTQAQEAYRAASEANNPRSEPLIHLTA